jgi:PucR family transcriptional regulator, purine catabolism regulatory protein
MPTLTQLCRALGDDLMPVVASGTLPEPEVTGVHISELIDPTPYLEGGELLLTIGMALTGHTAQAHAYTARLARFGVAGLGFGLGPVYDAVPDSLVRACEAAGLALLVVPAPTPFLTVARKYWSLIALAGQEELSASLGAHQDLVGAAGGPNPVSAVVRTLAGAVEGWAAQLSPEGDVLEVWPRTRRPSARQLAGEISRLGAGPHASATLPIGDDDVVLHPLTNRGRLTGFVATGCPRPMNAPDRQLVLAACSLLALQAEQQRRGTAGPRAARACVARLVLAGYLDAARALAVELGMSPLQPRVRVVALSGLTGAVAEEILDAIDAALPRPLQQLVAAADADEIWAILRPGDSVSALAVIERVRSLRAPDARLLISDELDVREISVHRPGMRRGLLEMAPGAVRDLARTATASSPGLSLEPLLQYTRADLVGAVVAYLRHRGQWEAAAKELGVHRNTLRHRVGTAMRVMKADLDDPDVASTLWLTLRARGLT